MGRTWQAQLVSSQNLNFLAGGGEEQSGNIRKLKSLHHHNRDTWNKYSMESFKGIVSWPIRDKTGEIKGIVSESNSDKGVHLIQAALQFSPHYKRSEICVSAFSLYITLLAGTNRKSNLSCIYSKEHFYKICCTQAYREKIKTEGRKAKTD